MKKLFETCEYVIYNRLYDGTLLEVINDIITYYGGDNGPKLVNISHVEFGDDSGILYEIKGNPLAVRYVMKKINTYIMSILPVIKRGL